VASPEKQQQNNNLKRRQSDISVESNELGATSHSKEGAATRATTFTQAMTNVQSIQIGSMQQ